MDFDWIEWFGCLLFAAFAYLIDSLPTMLMNLGIAGINVYFLWNIHSAEEQFKLIVASANSEYFEHFISTNQGEIELQTSVDELREANTVILSWRIITMSRPPMYSNTEVSIHSWRHRRRRNTESTCSKLVFRLLMEQRVFIRNIYKGCSQVI